jgi:DNA-binding MarR family transcriptional regulator
MRVDDEILVEEAVELLPRIVRHMHATFTSYAEAGGLTLGQMKALAFLYRNGRRTVGEIAEALGLAMPTASELVDKLAERGLIERGVNPADRRQVHVWLTAEAMAFAREVHALRRAQVRHAFADLEASERAVLVRGLRAISEAVVAPNELPVVRSRLSERRPATAAMSLHPPPDN